MDTTRRNFLKAIGTAAIATPVIAVAAKAATADELLTKAAQARAKEIFSKPSGPKIGLSTLVEDTELSNDPFNELEYEWCNQNGKIFRRVVTNGS